MTLHNKDQIRELFKQLDQDGNQVLTKDDFAGLEQLAGEKAVKALWAALQSEFDDCFNGDGQITYQEFEGGIIRSICKQPIGEPISADKTGWEVYEHVVKAINN